MALGSFGKPSVPAKPVAKASAQPAASASKGTAPSKPGASKPGAAPSKGTTLSSEVERNAGQCATILEESKWAIGFSWPEIQALGIYLTVARLVKGTVIFQEGSSDDTLSIITSGTISILKEVAGTPPKVLASVGAGQTLGEMSLVDGGHRSATAVAATEVTLLNLTRNSLDLMIHEKPALAAKFIFKLSRLLSQRLRMTSSNLADRM
ncbi:hypothetical protein CCP3SC1AL1_150014 [Gammaproteobacteria bacterium]